MAGSAQRTVIEPDIPDLKTLTGEARAQEMRRLATVVGLSYVAVARLFEVSRQRVAQIIGPAGPYTPTRRPGYDAYFPGPIRVPHYRLYEVRGLLDYARHQCGHDLSPADMRRLRQWQAALDEKDMIYYRYEPDEFPDYPLRMRKRAPWEAGKYVCGPHGAV